MIANESSDYSSDDSMSLSAPELVLTEPTEVSQSNKSKYDSNNDASDSPLKRAIKENETLIIQSILSPPPLSSLIASKSSGGNSKSSNSNSITDETTSTTTTTTVSEGLPPLLDYLFEDGLLTRIEYDRVDKGIGVNSAAGQVQEMLRILMESKGDGALEILLECLNRLDPRSETIRRLCAEFLPGVQENTERVVFRNEIKFKEKATAKKIPLLLNKYGRQQQGNKKARVPFELDSYLVDNSSSRKLHDFYFGRCQIHNSTIERTVERDDGKRKNADRIWGTSTQQQMNKAKNTLDSTDLRDFHLTNGCLETIRNLILDNCEESIKATGWEKVLRNMNGLLSTDVLSIKDLLFQIKTLDHQRALDEETTVAKFVRKIYKERRKLQQSSILLLEKQKSTHISEDKNKENDEALRRRNDRDAKGSSRSKEEKGIENKQEWNINWNQVIYHSFQVWKQRNGINSTFYSLIGVFQHSKLYQTADLLLEYKKEIQLRENEKDITDGSAFDVKNGTKTAGTSTTMLEKSDFLRKFYSPSRRSCDNNNGNFKPVVLTTSKDRVSASPVLSLDLL